MKIWIDLANSPHPLLFAPIAGRLRAEGHEVVFTARDNAQTAELARERWPGVDLIGGASPAGRVQKATAIVRRIADLRRWATAQRPDIALSHNSYAHIVAARSVRVPAVTAMDYEHQPANHVAFRLASTVIVPDVFPPRALRRYGAMNRKMVRYAGFKEELYVGDFEPDPRVLARLGLKRRPRVVVVARTPPEGTLYHRSSNPLFERAVRVVCAQADTVCVLLPRTDAQADAVQRLGLANCIVPDGAIDSRSLMYAADAMIGAGGTMTREAALMGIPTWTVFAGDAPAVDTALQQRGLLHRLTDPTALAALAPRAAVPASPQLLRERADLLIDEIVSATLATRRWRSRSTGESGRPGATRRPPGTASPPPPTSTEP